MKTHAELGARLLSSGSSRVLQMAAVIAATHHERWDGTGYPKGLSGEAIPLVGRIVAVADVFDALTHDRPYKSAWSVQRACEEIERSAGSQFDPRVVAAFLAMRSRTGHALRRGRRGAVRQRRCRSWVTDLSWRSPGGVATCSSTSTCTPRAPKPLSVGAAGEVGLGRGRRVAERACARAEQPARVQQLGELHRVGGGALAQVVGDDPQVRARARGRGRGGCARRTRRRGRLRRSPAGSSAASGSSSTVTPGAARSSSRARSGESSSRVCTLTASEWPLTTGTRTHVARDARSTGRRGSCASR